MILITYVPEYVHTLFFFFLDIYIHTHIIMISSYIHACILVFDIEYIHTHIHVSQLRYIQIHTSILDFTYKETYIHTYIPVHTYMILDMVTGWTRHDFSSMCSINKLSKTYKIKTKIVACSSLSRDNSTVEIDLEL
jgi:hypothetical protein